MLVSISRRVLGGGGGRGRRGGGRREGMGGGGNACLFAELTRKTESTNLTWNRAGVTWLNRK